MILYGEAGKSKKNSTASKVSYQKYYDSGKKDYTAPKSRTSYEYDELLFETRGDAESVLDAMNEISRTVMRWSVLQIFMIWQTYPMTTMLPINTDGLILPDAGRFG